MKKIFTLGILLSSSLLATEPKVYINMSPVLFDYSNNGTTTNFKPTGYLVKNFDKEGKL
jgi:hypothetical protein